jgi:phage tail protein X
MTTVFETVTIAGEDLTVSKIIWRRFKRDMPGLAERVYDGNYGLADLGPILPLGTVFKLPIDAPRPVIILPTLQLWPPGS